MSKKFLFGILFYLFFYQSLFAQIFIKGKIVDGESMEVLSSTIIVDVLDSSHYYLSDEEGNFTIDDIADRDSSLFRFHQLGYRDTTCWLKSGSYNYIKMLSKNMFKEVVVMAPSLAFENGKITMSVHQMKEIPALLSEPDPFKTFQSLPGVKAQSENMADLSVRGGNSDENLILIDDIPIYYLNHLGGFVSIMDMEAIQNASIWKSNFTAKYSSKASSIINFQLKKGNNQKRNTHISLSPLLLHGSINGPVLKNKLTYLVSGRRMMYDVISYPLQKLINKNTLIGYTFYDATSKLNYAINSKNNISLIFYYGKDHMQLNVNNKSLEYLLKFKNNWGNIISGFSYKYENQKHFTFKNTTFFSHYFQNYSLNETQSHTTTNEYLFKSDLTSAGNISEFNIEFSKNLKSNLGFNYQYLTINPSYTQNLSFQYKTAKIYNHEPRFFLSTELNFDKVKIQTGINARIDFLKITNSILEPRLSIQYYIKDSSIICLQLSRMTQSILNLKDYNTDPFPLNFWIPTTGTPIISDMIGLSYFKNLFRNKVSVSIETFIKESKHLSQIKKNTTIMYQIGNIHELIDNNLIDKSGGIELFIHKKLGTWTGWLSYTYLKVLRKNQNVDEKYYNAPQDIPHQINAVFNYKINPRVKFNAEWSLHSGRPINIANYNYQILDNIYNQTFDPSLQTLYNYYPINSQRSESFHVLNLALEFKKQKLNGIRSWTFSIYNLYNKMNAFYYYNSIENNESKLFKFTLFPLIPSVSYTFILKK